MEVEDNESDDFIALSTSTSASKRRRTEKKQSSRTSLTAASSSSRSDLTVPIFKKYLDYFETHVKNGMKFGVCVICKRDNVETEIKMKNSNTKGLKYHLSKFHEREYNFFFDAGNLNKNQRTLTEMFATKRERHIQVSKKANSLLLYSTFQK